ncbi:hypothetical protein DPMN_101959 [Dreissena polymorpha]|uniref:Uncharacterized protein n=1 Tax=Dreissena polymorpha TaxID=45954 RepID=A0A9D4LKS3_DREPO|nr:hypothetical protein DPMN_101959 [Dreissena polymorpha]
MSAYRFNEFMTACNEPMEDYSNYDDCYVVETEHEESSIESEQKPIFKQLSDKFYQHEQVYVDIHPDLASLVNNFFRNGLSEDNLDDICKRIHQPENCDSLIKTRVYQGIWRLMKSYTQAKDARLSAIQGVVLKASINMVNLVEKLRSMSS